MKAAEVAKILGISARMVYAIPARLLPRYKFGRAVRFAPADVEEYRKS